MTKHNTGCIGTLHYTIQGKRYETEIIHFLPQHSRLHEPESMNRHHGRDNEN